MTEHYRLYEADELEVCLANMAQQLTSRLSGEPLVMVGMLRRGAPLAKRLLHYYSCQTGQPAPPLYELKVKRYADDLSVLHPSTALTESPELAALDLANTQLLVVDDVLYEGHSLLRVCAYLAQLGARKVLTAVLVDRCVCTQPVHADLVGIRLQIAAGDVVECHVPPYEKDFCIEVVRHDQHRP